MRELFPEFNKPSPTELKKMWDEAIFVLDSNVLLSLYRLPKKARKKLLSTLEKIKDKVWIPHQVAMEFYRKRLEVMHDQERIYNRLLESLETSELAFKKQLEENAKNPFIDCKKILKKVSAGHKSIKDEMERAKAKHPDWLKSDTVEPIINKIFTGRVGDAYSEKQLQDLYQKGQGRYEKEIPPGYRDRDKDKNDKTTTKKYGDLVIWFQVIDKAKEVKKSIIFVTDDQKDDWWWKTGGTTIGARHELVKEIRDQAGVAFQMYQTAQFMEFADPYLSVKFGEDLIEQVKKLREVDDKEELVKTQDTLSGSSINSLTGANVSGVEAAQDGSDSNVGPLLQDASDETETL